MLKQFPPYFQVELLLTYLFLYILLGKEFLKTKRGSGPLKDRTPYES